MSPHALPWQSSGLGLLVTLALLAGGIPLARRIGWLDQPTSRKPHARPTPMVGGVAMFGGLLAGSVFLAPPPFALDILGSALTAVVLLGFWDDCRTLSTRIRLLFELLIAMLLIQGGEITVRELGNLLGTGPLNVGLWSTPFTVLCFVGTLNALNMSDGLDGLAAGQSFVSLSVMLGLTLWAGEAQWAAWIMLLLAVLLPFLLVNAPFTTERTPLTFMGDAGSKLLGLCLFLFTVSLSQKTAPPFAPVTALWLLAMPLMELFSSIVRRLLQRQSPFQSDKGHLHHRLQQRGFDKRQIFLLLNGGSLLFALTGALGHLAGVPDFVLFYGLLLLFVAYCWFVMRNPITV
ncbi:MAG: undecaprenyl/decaprenyl-phosphate alpha-N-acetylglucosaminyl 1-phosphate transferase [Magnetococcales bacterium]|nr:undecaprenyl/decaprenyl-phosphate alpha-N-acetylglucosaminyl 1-phosphate transferase [Magnetococcales bacterium]MBF0114300.1 undecaprenyl/decaprenyl-phosphate alpha-N-acetylglucosaminyl 1-phosphate transferase [Magnetococcales bacterium]